MRWREWELWEYPAYEANKVSDDVVVIGVDACGGKRRCDSVLKGLSRVLNDRVVILEAARPCVTSEQIEVIGNHPAKSVTYVVPSVSTIMYKNKVLDRSKTYEIQVPQAFDTDLLIEAHLKTRNENPTDDTMLMEEVHGIHPEILIGGQNLTKITFKEDMRILEKYL